MLCLVLFFVLRFIIFCYLLFIISLFFSFALPFIFYVLLFVLKGTAIHSGALVIMSYHSIRPLKKKIDKNKYFLCYPNQLPKETNEPRGDWVWLSGSGYLAGGALTIMFNERFNF